MQKFVGQPIGDSLFRKLLPKPDSVLGFETGDWFEYEHGHGKQKRTRHRRYFWRKRKKIDVRDIARTTYHKNH